MSIQTLLEAVEFLETSSNKSNLGGFASENSSKKDEKDSNDNEQKNEHQNNPHFPTNPTDQSTTADSASTTSSMKSQPAAMTSSTNPLFSQTLPLNLASYFDVNRKILNNSHSNSQQHRSNAPSNSVAPENDAKSLETSSQAILPDGSHRNNISYAKQPDKADLKWIATNSNTLQGHTVMCSNDKQLDSNIPLNSLLPSLVKSTEDEKAFCALQFKQIKRQVTLTHNQLEKIRRAHLKECFEALKSQLPGLGIRRSSNLTILKAANRHIKIVVKKATDNQVLREKLKLDLELNRKRYESLVDELSQNAGVDNVNDFLEEVAKIDDRERTISTSSVHSSILDDDQKSTSTASEAEEQRLSIATEPPKSKNVDCSLTAANIAALQADYAVKQRNEVGKVTISSPVKMVEQAPQKSPKPAPRVGYQKSPMKLYGQPSGRSATPSPPSNIVSFFPRFNCGGGGSPPLMVGEDLPYPTPRMVARKVDKGSVFGSVPSNPVYRVLNNQPTNVDEKSTLNRQTATVTNSPNQSMKPTFYGNPPNGPLPTFSGYQVKVKYVPTSTTTPQFALNQSNVPMKKRHYVSTNEMTSPKQARRDDGPKMTSLYIGASAAVLDQQNDRVNSTTSDNESDRESPMLNDPKRGQFRHWRKHITDRGGREWSEYRTKKDEGKKLMLHQYEPAVTSATKFHSKPKTTFALWDKKHHAISMDAVTSGKSKQTPPLIAPKSTAPTPNTTQSHSITQVCYTTLKKPSKPISTVVPQSVSPLVAATEQQTKTDFHLLPATPSTQAVKQMLQAVTDTSANHSFEVVHSKPNSNVISSNLPPISAPVVSNNQTPISNHTSPNLPPISNPTSSGDSPIQTSLPVVLTTNDGSVAKQQNILPPHGAMPLMIPVGYVMYQGGIPTSGLQFTPKTTHAGAFPDLLPMQTFQVQPADPGLVRVAPKRTMTPNRGRSESFPNPAVSSDSLEPPGEKKSKMNQLDSPSMCIVTPPARPTLQSQLVFPGNFILPGGGGAILGYPMQHYPTSQALQPIHMGQIGAGQNMASLSQIWPMNAGLGLQFATSGVTMPTVVASQQAPLALQVINTSNTGPS